jgi:hypothetical protein
MLTRAARFSLAITAAVVVVCGCGPGTTYNTPSEATEKAIAAGSPGATPAQHAQSGKAKVTKPPGPSFFKGSPSFKPFGSTNR